MTDSAFAICEINIKSPTNFSRNRNKHHVQPQCHYLNRILAGALNILIICEVLLFISEPTNHYFYTAFGKKEPAAAQSSVTKHYVDVANLCPIFLNTSGSLEGSLPN